MGSSQGLPLTAEHREVGPILPREKAVLGWSMVKCILTLKLSSLGSHHLGVQKLQPNRVLPCHQAQLRCKEVVELALIGVKCHPCDMPWTQNQ